MAYQHFYSRVPSRVSMFNKVDGFDTFAASDVFTRAYVEENLLPITSFAPGKYEAAYIRTGKLPPIYWRYVNAAGDTVLSSVSFIARDYTGERSSWLIHTLVPSEEERAAIIRSTDRQILSPEQFVTDIDGFKITYANASPIKDYEQLPYMPSRVPDVESLTAKYGASQLKWLIFAFLSVACGKCKNVYVGMGKNSQTISADALDLVNKLFQVFPHNVRDRIPFITYTTEYNKLNCFAVKFLPSDCMTMPAGKGYQFDLVTHTVEGIREADYLSEQMLVDFFFSLIADKQLRLRFVKYAQRAANADSSLAVPSFKTLNAIVTLFRQVSKAYTEKQLLPVDDKVLEMFSIYEKYRNILSPKEKCTVYNSLQRYMRLHKPIPTSVFNKVSKLYPSETPHVKSCVMRIMLDLIHTDIMRDKLFAFVKNNFDCETARSQSIICRHLIRVYYGGFLQLQILGLLDGCYAKQSEGTQDFVLDKLLLSIRTQSIRQQLFAFFEKQYDVFTQEQKKLLYRTLLDSLNEADDLSVAVVQFIDKHVGKEPSEVSDVVAEKIVAILDAECRKTNELIRVLATDNGFCLKAVLPQLLTWTNRKVFPKFTDIVVSSSVAKAAMIFYSCLSVDNPPADAVKGLSKAIDPLTEKIGDSDFFRLSDAYAKISRYVATHKQSAWFSLCDKLLTEVMQPSLCKRVTDCLCVKPQSDYIAKICKFAATYPFVKDAPLYAAVPAVQSILNGELPFTCLKQLYMLAPIKRERDYVSQLFEDLLLGSKEKISTDVDVEYLVQLNLVTSLIRSGELDLDKAYSMCYDGMERKFAIAYKDDSKKLAKSGAYAAVQATYTVICACVKIRATDVDDVVKQSVVANGKQCKIAQLISRHVVPIGNAAVNELVSLCSALDDSQVVAVVTDQQRGLSAFFRKLFKK